MPVGAEYHPLGLPLVRGLRAGVAHAGQRSGGVLDGHLFVITRVGGAENAKTQLMEFAREVFVAITLIVVITVVTMAIVLADGGRQRTGGDDLVIAVAACQ